MYEVKGKWALVTGASRGLGALIAQFLAERGCNLVLHARQEANCMEILEKVRSLGVQAYALGAELADAAQVTRMLDEIEVRGTEISIVFNNAAIQIAYRSNYFSTPVSDFTESFKINTIAPAMICYRLLPKMKAVGTGRIINVTSGIKNEPEQAGYSASKAALDKFTTDLAQTVNGTDVIISLADPGWCRTDLGGPSAPNSPESSMPGMVLGAFINDGISGRLFSAQNFSGMSLERALEYVQNNAG